MPITHNFQLNNMPTTERVFYLGQSMKATFRDGDYLTIEPVALADIHPGDVLVYCRPQLWNPDPPKQIVHRVMAVGPGGLLMRGDNNLPHDIDVIRENNVIGRVTYVERAGKLRPVQNGIIGLLRGRSLHGWRTVQRSAWRLLVAVAGAPYRRFKKTGLVQRFWRPTINRIVLQTADGPLIKYVSRGRTVAQWWPQTGRFTIVRPYDLVITPPARNPDSVPRS